MVLLISNDPLAPRQRLVDASRPPPLGPADLADADHLVVGRGRIADVSGGWLKLSDIEIIERFYLWAADQTVLAYNPDGPVRTTSNRPDQQQFRERLMRSYGGRCAVSGCAVPELLDAAHLTSWRVGGEGVLLRVDLHRLLDRGLAEIRDGRYRLLPPIPGYEEFDGAKLRRPNKERRRK